MAGEKHTVADLIRILQDKDQTAEIEYIVCKTDGELVTVQMEKQAKAVIKMLKFFGG